MSAPAGFVPDSYEKYLVPILFAGYARDLAERVKNAKPSKVLELACGTGVVTRELMQALDPDASLVATDFNPAMLEYARTTAQAEKFPNLDWQTADATALPFDDDSFDLLVCQFGFMFFPDKSKAMAEVKRVLKPGGRLIFNVWGAMEDNPVFYSVELALQELLPEEPVPIIPTPCSMADHELLSTLLVEAGFEDIQVTDVILPVRGHPASAVASGFTRGTPVGALLAERGIESTHAHERLEATARKLMGDTLDSTMLAIICEARA